MSTVPHHAAGAANAEVPPAMTAPGGRDFKAAIEHFITTADALGAPRPASEELNAEQDTHTLSATRRPEQLLVLPVNKPFSPPRQDPLDRS